MQRFIKLVVFIYLLKLVRGSASDIIPQPFSFAGIFYRLTNAPASAAMMAIEDINNFDRRSTRIELFYNTTDCDSKSAAAQMYKLMSIGRQKPVIFAGCPEDCETIGKSAQVWNTVTMCYGIPPIGSHIPSHNHPGLFTARPNPFSVIPSLVKFILHFGWKRVAILYEDYGNYFDIAQQISFHLEKDNIETFLIQSLPWTDGLDLVQSKNARVILTLGSATTSREILCQIYHRRLFGTEKYVWFFLGPTGKEWFLRSDLPSYSSETETEEVDVEMDGGDIEGNIRHTDCKPEELILAADGHFTARAITWNSNESLQTFSTMTVKDFKKRLNYKLQSTGEHIQADYDEAPLAYDSVWAAYLALNKTVGDCIQEGNGGCEFTYDNYELGNKIQDILKTMRFEGISGDFSYDSEGRRSISNGCVKMERFSSGVNKFSTVAWHFNYDNNFSWVQIPFGEKVPGDGKDEIPGFGIPSDPFGTESTSEASRPKCNSSSYKELSIQIYIIFYYLLFY